MRVLRIKETNYPQHEETFYYEDGLYYYHDIITNEAWYDFRMSELYAEHERYNLSLDQINKACAKGRMPHYIIFEELSAKLSEKEYYELKAVEIIDTLIYESTFEENSCNFGNQQFRDKCVNALNELWELTQDDKGEE